MGGLRCGESDSRRGVGPAHGAGKLTLPLLDLFERISETEQKFIELDRAVHFDKLGVNQAVLQVEVTYERKRLVAPQQFLPLLDRIAKNESYLHMARERAASLADAFRNNQSAGATQQ